MSNPDRWRDPVPGEWVVVMDRWTIENNHWDLYTDLCSWPNRYIYERESVIWVVPEPEWLLMVLRWPELRTWGKRHEPR